MKISYQRILKQPRYLENILPNYNFPNDVEHTDKVLEI